MDSGEQFNEVTPTNVESDRGRVGGEPGDSPPTEDQPVDTAPIPEGTRAALIAKLPESWSESEVDHFIRTYYGKLSEEIGDAEAIAARDSTVEEAVESHPAPTSTRSVKGLTLDTYVIVDGRSLTLRAIAEAGALLPFRTTVQDGNKKFPRAATLYCARLIDRNRIFEITEETYKVLSRAYPQEHPIDEPLSAEAVRNIQAPVTVMKEDKLERRFKR